MLEVIVGLLSLGTIIFIIGMQASRSQELKSKRSIDTIPQPASGIGQNADQDKRKPELAAVNAGQGENISDEKRDRMARAGN